MANIAQIFPEMRISPGALKSFPALFIVFMFLVMASCQKTAIQYGQQYIDNGITNIILIDSITPVVSTVYKDSVITSQTGTLLVGNYQDPYFGKTSSNAYLQLAPPTLADLLNNAQYDSLVLLMKTSGGYYGDTMLPVTISVNQLSQEIKFAENQFSFSNIASFPVNSTALGTKTFVLRPFTHDSANIRLNDVKGMELYNLIKTKSDILKDKAVFTDYFKGLNISASSNNNDFGFRDSVIMRLYYHQTDLAYQNKYFDFSFDNASLQFNHIAADRSGTPLTALNTLNNELPSTATGNVGYLQSATGIYLKIAFPSIRKLLERTDYVKIIRAQLIVKPLINSFNGLYPLPPVLLGAQTDGANEPGSPITAVTSGSAQTESGSLFIDNVSGLNTSYSYDVTRYLQQEIATATVNKDGLLLIPAADTRYASFNRLLIGNAQNLKNKLQLNLYYVSVNK